MWQYVQSVDLRWVCTRVCVFVCVCAFVASSSSLPVPQHCLYLYRTLYSCDFTARSFFFRSLVQILAEHVSAIISVFVAIAHDDFMARPIQNTKKLSLQPENKA